MLIFSTKIHTLFLKMRFFEILFANIVCALFSNNEFTIDHVFWLLLLVMLHMFEVDRDLGSSTWILMWIFQLLSRSKSSQNICRVHKVLTSM